MTVLICDLCKKSPAVRSYFYVGKQFDGVGSTEDVHESLDLCLKHLSEAQNLMNDTAPKDVYAKLSPRRLKEDSPL